MVIWLIVPVRFLGCLAYTSLGISLSVVLTHRHAVLQCV